MYGSPWIVLPSASVSFDVRAPVQLGLEQLAQRDLLARAVRDLDADGRLARDAIDQHRFGLHREAEVVGEAGDLRVLHAGIRLELEGGDDRARMDLHDAAFDRELAALLLEQPRAVHQLALVDLALGLRRRRAAPAAAACSRPCGARPAPSRRLRIERQRRGHVHLRRLRRRERLRVAECPGGRRGLRRVVVFDRLRAPERGGDRVGEPLLRRLRCAGGGRRSRRRARLRDPRLGGGAGSAAGSAGDGTCAGGSVLSSCASRSRRGAAARAAAPRAIRGTSRACAPPHRVDGVADRAEEAPERELRRHDDREEDQRQDDDERAGAVQVFRRSRLASNSPT